MVTAEHGASWSLRLYVTSLRHLDSFSCFPNRLHDIVYPSSHFFFFLIGIPDLNCKHCTWGRAFDHLKYKRHCCTPWLSLQRFWGYLNKMSFMRNPMVLWVRCMQNSIFPTKHFRGTSLQGFAQTNSLKHLHLISSKSQNIPLCSIPAEIYPKTQFSEQFRCCHLIFARSFSTSSHHAMPSYPLIKGTGSQEQEKILSEMVWLI